MAAEVDPDARERAIAALASGASISEAARRAGYSRKHVHSLLKVPAFAAELEQRRATSAAAAPATSADEQLALEALREIAKESSSKFDLARVAAAKALLAHEQANRRPSRSAKSPTPAPPILLQGDGDRAAAEWLRDAIG